MLAPTTRHSSICGLGEGVVDSTDDKEEDQVMAVPGHQRAHQILASAEDELATAFRRAEASFQHMGDRGDARESAVRSFLTDQLPARFVVTAGEVMDAAGNVSGQTDVVIYDGLNTRPLFTTNGVALLPAEALLATIEVKSKLDKSETDKAVAGMVKLRRLRPWDAPWSSARRNGRAADDMLPRLFTTIFGFTTDLVEPTWPTNEMSRLRASCAASSLPTAHIDRLVVLDRGVLLPSAGRAYIPDSGGGILGLWFFQLVSFLSREVARREPFPWDSYKLSERGSWRHVAEEIDDAPTVERATSINRVRARRHRNKNLGRIETD